MTGTSTREQPGSADGRQLPDRVTMPLLALVTRESVDEDYRHAAERRAAAGDPRTPERTSLRGAAVATVVFGLMIALAAVQTARNADVQEASRTALVDRIAERRAEVEALRERIAGLRDTNADLEATDARQRGELVEALQALQALQVTTGFVAVGGPGLRITVSDNPDGSADGRVRASDLRRLVNGLWQAGAEAVAVNGRRLSVLSAIVQSDIAVQVNRGPLTPPYVVSAIGEPGLGARLQDSPAGVQFQSLAEEFGFEVERQDEDEVVLPAAPESQLRLRYAERGNGPAGGPIQDEEDVP